MGLRLVRKAALAAMFTVVVGCGGGTQGSSPASSYYFDYANLLQSGALFVAIGDGVKSASATAGVKLKTYNNDYPSAETALRNAQLMVQDKPDVIIDYNAVAGIGDSIGKKFNDAKIPCIAVNVPIKGCSWYNLVNKEIGTDTANVVIPIMQSKGWTGSDTVVILLQSAAAGPEVNDCIRYFYVTVSHALPGFTQANPSDITAQTTKIGDSGWQLEAGGKLDTSYTAVKNALQGIPASKHIVLYSINDDSVLGGWRAISEAHRESTSLVAGLGSDEETRSQLRTNPQWVAEGELFPSMWGEYLMAMAVAIKKGKTAPDLTKSPQVVMTKDTVDKYFKVGGDQPISLPALSPEDQYLKDAGVLQKFHNIQGL